MGAPEARYKLFRKIFSRKLKLKNPTEKSAKEADVVEAEVECEKARKLRLAIEAQQRLLTQLKTLEDSFVPRYNHIIRHGIFGILLTLTMFSFVNLLHALFLFESYPSDPLDVFRGVNCDTDFDTCTIRYYFDLEPPSVLHLACWVTLGILGLVPCIRCFFSIDTFTVLMHFFGALLLSVTWIIRREKHYALYAIPL